MTHYQAQFNEKVSEYFPSKFILITQTSKNQQIKYHKGYQQPHSDICTKKTYFFTCIVSSAAPIKFEIINAREIFHQIQKAINIVFTKLFVYFCIADKLKFRVL